MYMHDAYEFHTEAMISDMIAKNDTGMGYTLFTTELAVCNSDKINESVASSLYEREISDASRYPYKSRFIVLDCGDIFEHA